MFFYNFIKKNFVWKNNLGFSDEIFLPLLDSLVPETKCFELSKKQPLTFEMPWNKYLVLFLERCWQSQLDHQCECGPGMVENRL